MPNMAMHGQPMPAPMMGGYPQQMPVQYWYIIPVMPQGGQMPMMVMPQGGQMPMMVMPQGGMPMMMPNYGVRGQMPHAGRPQRGQHEQQQRGQQQ